MSKIRKELTYDEAVKMLPNGDTIHTFRSGSGILLGANHPRNSLLKTIKTHKVELSGEQATAMHHGMVLLDKTGCLFIETKKIKEKENE